MDYPSIKREIKEEPPEAVEDASDFEHLLIPKIELEEQHEPTSSLSCPKCDITYYSAMSIKNHIQVCKKDRGKGQLPLPMQATLQKIKNGTRKKLSEDERRSIRILEQSCFVNDKHAIMENDEEQKPQFCKECEVAFDSTSNFARHLYAHTFIKVDDEDMPCICIDCGFDFEDKRFLALHLEDADRCSGNSKVLFPCGLCKKIFTRKDNLRDDLRSHIDVGRKKCTKRQYKCKKCNNEYGGQTILTIHHLSHKRRKAVPLSKIKPSKRQRLNENNEGMSYARIKEEPL